MFLVYLNLEYDGEIVNDESRVYYNKNSANSYRRRKQNVTSYGRWKVKRVTLI